MGLGAGKRCQAGRGKGLMRTKGDVGGESVSRAKGPEHWTLSKSASALSLFLVEVCLEMLLLAGELGTLPGHNLLLRGEVLETGLYPRNFTGQHYLLCPQGHGTLPVPGLC